MTAKRDGNKTIADLIRLGFTNVEQQDALPPGPERSNAKAKGDAFTDGVDMLRGVFPNKRINKLMGMVWDLVGGKIVPLVGGMPVATLVFAVVGKLDDMQARIFVPDNYLKMIKEDGCHQLGALVFTGSQAVDFWNDKILPQDDLIKRASAYEAEFLMTFGREFPGWKTNVYQKKLLADFPQGLDTPGVSLYEHKPVPNSSSDMRA